MTVDIVHLHGRNDPETSQSVRCDGCNLTVRYERNELEQTLVGLRRKPLATELHST
jgi:hypothetical protein